MPANVKFTKEQILEAAFHLAASKGLNHVTIRAIASEIGSSIAPIYVNFRSIDDVKKALMDQAQSLYKTMVENSKYDDLFLRFADASITFSKKYPKIYNAFLLEYDDASSSEKNHQFIYETIRTIKPYKDLSKKELTDLILSMQAMQVGLSVMARKRYYKNLLTPEAMITLLNNTGNSLTKKYKLNGENNDNTL